MNPNTEYPDVVLENDCFKVVQYDYQIDVEAATTPAKILSWLYHLMGKQWITVKILEEFMVLAVKTANIDCDFVQSEARDCDHD